MAYADDLLEGPTAKPGCAKPLYEDVCNFDLDTDLDDLYRIRMVRQSSPKSIIGESSIISCSGGIDVAIAWCKVPIGIV